MNFFKTAAVVSAIALSSFSVNAEILSVAGITWDTAYVDASGEASRDDFFAAGSYVETLTGGDLSGVGTITTVNGQNSSEFCVVAGCKLTYNFDGFVIATDGSVDATNGSLTFNVVHADMSPTTTFLELSADTGTDFTYTSIPGLLSSITGLFNVEETAGTAWKNFDTDQQAGGTDMSISAVEGIQTGAVFRGTSVPEPTTLAIFGLGLLGLVARRKA